MPIPSNGSATMKHPLELRVPPALLFLGAIAAALGLGRLALLPLPAFGAMAVLKTVLIVLGGTTIALGLFEFSRSRTTVDPTRPETASTLVSSGIYRLTRNPMYLGMLLFLLAAAIRAGDWLALIPAIGFVIWMNRFQIGPEEQALTGAFGADYTEYCRRVRRWV